MKAVQLISVGAPLEEREIPTPSLQSSDVLVRVMSAGICHSDAHYRRGVSSAGPLPMTLGHEVAGIVEEVGRGVEAFASGDRVCLHYLVTCGVCRHCSSGGEQFCSSVSMIGKNRDGGFAEFIALPARNLFRVDEDVPLEHAAVMMCSSVTAFHAMRKARLRSGDRVAVFGVGGLGASAIRIAQALGAIEVFAVDVDRGKLGWADEAGAKAIDARDGDAASAILDLTNGQGVDVSVDFAGKTDSIQSCVRCAGVHGRAAMVALTETPVPIDTYVDLVAREVEVIGVSDHLGADIESVLALYKAGQLGLDDVVTRTVPLRADAVNAVLDELQEGAATIRTVVRPHAID